MHHNDFQESNQNLTTETILTDPIVETTDHIKQSNQFNASGIHPYQLNQDLNGNIKRIPDHIWNKRVHCLDYKNCLAQSGKLYLAHFISPFENI